MIGSIINTFSNCFKIPELKSRIGFTFLLLGIWEHGNGQMLKQGQEAHRTLEESYQPPSQAGPKS